ncbi:MAG: SpoVK/Ycf46/Vps4 family AAA+-type ATPase [Cocleimonas sp.]|jgi:SpoVK/Ycf46/Vps4 family AAA+-type ATPase
MKKTEKTLMIDIATLALNGTQSDLRLYLAKEARKFKSTDPDTYEKLEKLLKSSPARNNSVLRRSLQNSEYVPTPSPEEDLSLLKYIDNDNHEQLILSEELKGILDQVIAERNNAAELHLKGLNPTSSIIFQGPPGVGKTASARWLASKLNLPLYTLDLTSVMSSLLGKTGNNLRSVIDFAKTHPCILLLDEIDAIAKKRSDEADVGELKRLVTVMLQELENWPDGGMLIAATNHPELVDPALWRRFDMEVTFFNPALSDVGKAIDLFLGDDIHDFKPLKKILINSLNGTSYSHIKRIIYKLRKLKVINPKTFNESAIKLILPDVSILSRSQRIEWAVRLVKDFGISQQKSSALTTVSRDTIRKRISVN